jgi:lipopolysaccharide transport system permease protein
VASSPREVEIYAGRAERHYWADLWRYRELFYFLAWRDILVRYKQTVVGIAWAVIRPLVTMAVFTLIFGNFAQLPSEGMPYPVLVFSALLPWQLFASAVTDGSNSLVNNASMVSKTYFPRIIVPVSSVVVSVVDFLISIVILAVLMALYGVSPGWKVLLLPLFVLLTCIVALGMTILFSALTVRYRDFRYVVGFIVLLGLFISPVGFSSTVVPQAWQPIYALNPMVGVIDGFRWCLSHASVAPNASSLVSSALVSTALLAIGIGYFRKTERTFADVI